MPIGDYASPSTPGMKNKQYPLASKLSPDELQALLDQGYTDYGDGELIPPMGGGGKGAMTPGMVPGEYSNPGLKTANPGANATGGPSLQSDIRSDIFKTLYRQGKRSGNDALMNMGQPPMQPRPMPEMPVPPWEQPMQTGPTLPPLPPSPGAPTPEQYPLHLRVGNPAMQQQGGNPMASRFPRAARLMGRMGGGY